jgi:hypothetical protein
MRVEITKDKYIKIIAESIIEAIALESICREKSLCLKCRKQELDILIDYSILNTEDKDNILSIFMKRLANEKI